MPVPTIATVRVCATVRYFQTEVVGSTGTVYRVHWGLLPEPRQEAEGALYGWQCECKAYKFRGTCKHILEVRDHRCAWNSDCELTECARDRDGASCCPECGGPVIPVRVAV